MPHDDEIPRKAMYRLLYFIRKTYVAIIFIVLEIVAIRAYAYSTPYTQSRLLALSNSIVGSVHGMFGEVGHYFSLRSENIRLTERIAELENRLDACREYMPQEQDTIATAMHAYEYVAARVVSNSINRPQNFITLDKGFNDGVAIDMAVISPEGFAVGYVVNCSENYSVAMTLLNTAFRTSGKLASDGNPGSVHWSGGDPTTVDFDEVSKYATIERGEVVTTTRFSHYFPPDLTIGTVESFELSKAQTTFNVRVRLAADMARLGNVLLVNNTSAGEINALERAPIKSTGGDWN